MKAFVLGCSGLRLTEAERSLFRDADPWGFILFRRNIGTPDEVRRLTGALRESVGRDAPILIDQEGGRVQRMGPPHWPRYPAGAAYGRLSPHDPLWRRALVWLGARLIAHDLRDVGIDVNCAPILDVPVPGANDVIGDRAYHADPAVVSVLGRAAAEGFLAGSVLPVIKHIPGHGRANADSHLALPVVDAPLAELAAHDFMPFRALADMPAGMSAHIVFTALDPERPATVSPAVIAGTIRGDIGFGGLLFSDDLSMQALDGSIAGRAAAALAAGCDIALHCNGDFAEMTVLAGAVGGLTVEAERRSRAALARIRHAPEPFDPVEARAHLETALANPGALANS
ncbi:beta-N-acetylhexosaminidase [Pseudochelatococcus sp. B33]